MGSIENEEKMSFLRKIDLFGYQPPIKYDGDDSFRSKFGGGASIFIVSLYSLVAAFILWQFFSIQPPQTNINTVYVTDPVGFNMTENILPIAFGLEDPTTQNYDQFIDPTIYNITATYTRFWKNGQNGSLNATQIDTNIPLTTCDKMNLNLNYFENINLTNLYCFATFQPEGLNLSIHGDFNTDTYGYLSIDIYRCTGPTCKDAATIDSKLQGGYFSAYYINRQTQPTDYSNPVQEFPTDFFTAISPYFRKENVLYIADNEIISNNLINSNLASSTIKFESISSVRSDVAGLQVNTQQPHFYNMVIRMDNNKIVSLRTYLTLNDYLAQFGGLAQLIMTIALILTSRTKRTQLYVDLVKKFAKHEQDYQLILSRFLKYGRKKSAEKEEPTISELKTQKTIHRNSKRRTTEVPAFMNRPREAYNSETNRLTPFILEIPVENKTKPTSPDYESPESKAIDAQRQIEPKSPSSAEEKSVSPKDVNHGIQGDTNVNFLTRLKGRSQITSGSTLIRKHETKGISNFDECSPVPIKIEPGSTRFSKYHSENQRYEYLDELLKSVTGLKVFIYSFFPCLMKSSRTAATVMTAEDDIYRKFDFVTIMKFIEEFDKLKRMLLTRDQLMLFNLVPGNQLCFNENEGGIKFTPLNHMDLTMGKKDTIEDTNRENIIEAFDNIWGKQDPSELDKNLLGSLAFLYYDHADEKDRQTPSEMDPSSLHNAKE